MAGVCTDSALAACVSTGSVGDAGAYFRSGFQDLVATNQFLDPAWKQTLGSSPGSATVDPYIIGDAAFPLQTHLMKLYAGDNLTPAQAAFNSILVRARRQIEQAFGRLCARWQVLKAARPHFTITFIREVVILCCALHNICQRERALVRVFLPEDAPDEMQDRERIIRQAEEARRSAQMAAENDERDGDACAVRDLLAQNCLERILGGYR